MSVCVVLSEGVRPARDSPGRAEVEEKAGDHRFFVKEAMVS